MDSLPAKPLAVFYDSCVPWKQLRAVVPRVALFADHIFVCDRFPQKVVENDRQLFEEVVRTAKKEYPQILYALFITVDGDFIRQVRSLRGYGTAVKVVYFSIGPEGVQSKNWEMAVELASKLAAVYAKIRARVCFKRESEEAFRSACKEILDEYFGRNE